MTGKTIAAQNEARIKKTKALESVFKNKILLIDSSTCLQPPSTQKIQLRVLVISA
jgi:hypothetical protein